MTDLLERAVASLRALPPDHRDDVARMVLELAGEPQPAVDLSDAERASLAPSLAEAEKRVFASDDEVKAVWAKHGL